jgi:hypothetical protein
LDYKSQDLARQPDRKNILPPINFMEKIDFVNIILRAWKGLEKKDFSSWNFLTDKYYLAD